MLAAYAYIRLCISLCIVHHLALLNGVVQPANIDAIMGAVQVLSLLASSHIYACTPAFMTQHILVSEACYHGCPSKVCIQLHSTA